MQFRKGKKIAVVELIVAYKFIYIYWEKCKIKFES